MKYLLFALLWLLFVPAFAQSQNPQQQQSAPNWETTESSEDVVTEKDSIVTIIIKETRKLPVTGDFILQQIRAIEAEIKKKEDELAPLREQRVYLIRLQGLVEAQQKEIKKRKKSAQK